MDYEKKYKEALEKLRSLHDDYDTVSTLIDIKEELEHIFPELKVDEDERIRKDIIEFFENCNIKHLDWIAWLEKQGDKDKLIQELGEYKVKYTQEVLNEYLNINNNDNERLRKTTIDFLKEFADKGYENAIECIDWLERQDNQKLPIEKLPEEMKSIGESLGFSTQKECDEYNKMVSDLIMSDNKDKPKFKVGDWVVSKTSNLVYRVDSILLPQSKCYYLSHNGSIVLVNFGDEENYRLWTVADAKDGDILEFGDHGRLVVGIVSYINKSTGKVDVSCLLESNKFKIGNFYALDTIKPYPATKEQCDTLFAKMKEAGYEWDAEKKELKKIEDKLQIKKGKFYKCIKSYHCLGGSEYWFDEGKVYFCEKDGYLRPNYNNLVNIYDCENWQSYFRPYTDTENSAWSGDDEAYMTYILVRLKQYICDENFIECNNWLKSIKERIGGKL